MKYVWAVTNTYNNLRAQLWGYIIYNDKSKKKNITILSQLTSHKGTNTITQTKNSQQTAHKLTTHVSLGILRIFYNHRVP